MKWINLGNPQPRFEPKRYRPIVWPNVAGIPFPPPANAVKETHSFAEVALQRRTHREFAKLNLDQLGALMELTCRIQELGNDDLGFPLSRRPCPSAGAIHPIHVLVIRPDADSWYRYDPYSHTLHMVPSRMDVQSVMSSMQEVLTAPTATLLFLAAEPGMTSSKYEDAASLVWRDAGVILGFLAMAAEALSLSFCPLGVTGEPWISQLIDQPGLAGVGAAFVGSRPC